MAWMHKDEPGNEGVYPMHRGEYCGNSSDMSRELSRTMQRMQKDLLGDFAGPDDSYYKTVRKGKPHDCPAGTSAEMEAKGYYGLYLIESREPYSWEEPVLTPPELMEPGKEHLYNVNGVPGLTKENIDA